MFITSGRKNAGSRYLPQIRLLVYPYIAKRRRKTKFPDKALRRFYSFTGNFFLCLSGIRNPPYIDGKSLELNPAVPANMTIINRMQNGKSFSIITICIGSKLYFCDVFKNKIFHDHTFPFAFPVALWIYYSVALLFSL